MSITNITDRERALSTEVQQLKEELLEQARIVGMSTDREYALMGKLARQDEALKLALEALENVFLDTRDRLFVAPAITAIREDGGKKAD